ncbi:MAG: serine/threonine-protein kinase [Kofleriaceae bacterium]
MPVLAGKYELDRRLGIGGMAEVFLARLVGKDGFTRRVAIKRVLAHLAADDTFVNMFVAEAQMCARLQHPNIVSVLDFDRDEDGRPFLVIELVDGPSLADLANGDALPAHCAIHVATELLRGLAYAHDLPDGEDGVRGIVHRDISPHNVLLSWEGAVKLSDFGIAKARAASGVTASDLLKGKPAYMSPEQANGEALDRRSDLFAVGIVLWELLVGRSLFSGNTTQETLARVLFAPVPSPRSLRPEVPADVDAVVTKLLARDKRDRYANADEAIAALIACKDSPRDGRGSLVAELADRFANDARNGRPLLDHAPTARTPDAQPLPSPRDATRPAGSRARALLFALGALALASVAVATTVIVLERREARSTSPTPSVAALGDAIVVDGATPADAATVVANIDAGVQIAAVVDAHANRASHADARVVGGAARDRDDSPSSRVSTPDARVADNAASDPVPTRNAMEDSAVDVQEWDLKATARAAARKQMVQEQGGYGGWIEFPVSSSIKPDDVYARARREAERLLGKVEDGEVLWKAIKPDGTVDMSGGGLVRLRLGAVQPEDAARCYSVDIRWDRATADLDRQECRGLQRPRCTARQLHQRAVAQGAPATVLITALLTKSGWSITGGDRDLLVPNDCN